VKIPMRSSCWKRGQRLFIFKNRNIVIATTGGGFEAGDLDNLILHQLKPSIKIRITAFN